MDVLAAPQKRVCGFIYGTKAIAVKINIAYGSVPALRST